MKSKSSLKSTIKAVAAALCVVSACAYGANLPQVAFHVSPTGDDSADGSRERPFATVARARDAVRSLKKSGALPKGGVNVWLRGGEYPMRESLVLGKENSGADGAPVAYRAWKGEQRLRRRSCAGTCACRSCRQIFRPSPASSRFLPKARLGVDVCRDYFFSGGVSSIGSPSSV